MLERTYEHSQCNKTLMKTEHIRHTQKNKV